MVYSTGFENRHTERYREFKSHRLRFEKIEYLLVLNFGKHGGEI